MSHEQCLDEYMQLYGSEILRLCYTYVKDWQTAEDLAQETFIKFYRYGDGFQAESTVKTYLYRIAINVCHTYLASWKFKKVTISQSFQKLLKAKEEVQDVVVERSEAQQLVQSIEQLAPKYKDVILLFYYAEMSLAEISEALHIPVNTVKTRLARGRSLLKTIIEEERDACAFD